MSYSPAEKLEIIRLVETSDIGVKRTLREIGVSRSTFYEWYHRYLEDGPDGLEKRTRSAQSIWNWIPEDERTKIANIALQNPERSCREVAYLVIDQESYFVSESSVYRILREKGIIAPPVFGLNSAADSFNEETSRRNEMWQTDFTYFKIIHWGWYYLITILDDYTRYIIHWELCKNMTWEQVEQAVSEAVKKTGVKAKKISHRPRLLSDNGSCFVSKDLKAFMDDMQMAHIHGRPYHPQTQGKIERYHRSMKNIIRLDNYYSPGELEARIAEWVDYYNNRRYHESLDNVTPADVYYGRSEEILKKRERIKKKTMKRRLKQYRRRLDFQKVAS